MFWIHIGSLKGFRAPPAKDMGLMGQEGKCTSHEGLVRPPYGPAKEEKERGEGKGKSGIGFPLPSLPPPPSFLPPPTNMAGGHGQVKEPK